MTQTYRTTDLAKWGTGQGSNLSASQVDNNFWDIIQRVVTLEALPEAPAGIDHFSVTGDQFYVHLTDETTVLGPYTLPTATFRARGEWTPATVYAVLDTFTINGSLYVVTFAHTSDATSFDPGANDGSGHDYYSLMIETPGSSLPAGGAVAMVLEKSTTADYTVTWGYKTPSGGGAGEYLRQKSGTQDDTEWTTIPADEVSFTPVTSSALTSDNVADALEELSSSLSSGTTALSDLTDVDFATGEPTAGTLLMFDGSHWTSVAGGANDGQILVYRTTPTTAWVAEDVSTSTTDTIQFVIDGGGSAITTGYKGYLHIPYAATITQVVLLADQTSNIVVDIYKCTYTQFDASSTHPVSGDKITASAPPTISSATKSKNTTLTGWTTSIAADDVLAFNVTSVSVATRVTIALKVTK